MKIFFLAGDVPWENSTVEGVSAVHIQLDKVLKAFLTLGHEITFQIIFSIYHPNTLDESETKQLDRIQKLGVSISPPIFSNAYTQNSNASSTALNFQKYLRLIFNQSNISDFYPGSALKSQISERIASSGCQIAFIFASYEGIAAMHQNHDIPKITYVGDIDFHPGEIRLEDYKLFYENMPTWKRILLKLWFSRFRQAHVKLMKDVDILVNTTASNSEFYEKVGHAKTFYAGPPWFDGATKSDLKRNSNKTYPFRIIGYLGNLGNTASTYGLKFLLQDVLPILHRKLGSIDYEIHIIGGGQIKPELAPYLKQEKIVVRGWVKDLDQELKSCDLFLILDNAGRRLGTDTRTAVAWSMGLCIVAHQNSIKAMPEIKHLWNALVGGTPQEVADCICQAVTDPDLNLRLRQNGRKTYEEHFDSMVWTKKIVSHMEGLLKTNQKNESHCHTSSIAR